MRDEDGRDGWHLDKRVPISIIVTLVIQFGSGLWVLAEMRKDIDLLKMQVTQQRDRDDRQDLAAAQAVDLVRKQLERMESKLDRIIEVKR